MYRRFIAVSLTAVALATILVAGNQTASAGDCSGQATILGTDLPTIFPAMPRALQNNPTGFGDATPPTESDSEGNELNRLYMANDATKLYIGITGNTVRVDALENTVLVFIDTGDNGGSPILNTSGITGSNALKNLDRDDMTDGVTLDFAPEYCLAVWNVGGVQNAVLHDLTDPMDTGVALTLGTQFAVDNSNLAGVNDIPSSDPVFQTANAATATTGFEFAIELVQLGLTSSSTINVQALLVGGGGFISNQALPPINPTSGSVGGGRPCVGDHNPNATPAVLVDFSNATNFPGNQFVSYTCNPGGSAPSGAFNGADIPTRYGPVGQLLATQNNYTCFGNAAPYSPIPTGGAELDQIFVKADFSKLYIGVTGNVPFFGGNNDTLMIFIDNGPGDGTQQLSTNTFTGGSGALQGMSNGFLGGFTFDNGFEPEYCIMYWRAGGQHNARIMSCVFDEHIDGLEFSPSQDRHINPAVNAYSADLGNIVGVNDIPGDDPLRQQSFADGTFFDPDDAPTSGVQFSLKLNDLGIDASGGTANLKLVACVVSGSGFVSNQFLPPLNPTDPTPENDSASFSDAPLPLAITDDNMPVSDTRTVAMANIDRVTDINVSLNITHPDVSQLSVSLRHDDSGTTVQLVAPGSQAGSNLNITFDSEGAPAVQPAASLLSFNGLNPNGNWTMIVTDTVTGQSGSLGSWGIAVTEYTGGNVPCLGQFDAVDNYINLATDPRTPGDQFLDLSVPANTSNRPTNFTGLGIPAAFGNTALTTQNNYTCFGNAVEAAVVNLPGSEADQLMVRNTNDRLRIGVTGNLENNGNAMVLLLDTVAGGPSTLPVLSTPPDVCSGLDGLTLDPGFNPDYAVVVQRDPTAGVPVDDYSVFIKNIQTNFTRSLGRLTRNQPTGELADPIANQNGSELDQLFIQNDADRLYIGITGNLEANGNAYIVFIETPGSNRSNVLDTDYTGFPTALRSVHGDHLDIGFAPDFAIVINRSGGFYSAQLVDMTDLPPGTTVTNLTFQSSIGDNTYVGDNSNGLGVSSNVAHDTTPGMNPPLTVQEENAATALRGIQIALDRDSLGHPDLMINPPVDGATLSVGVILGSSTGFWSNQTLPGLGGGKNNLGSPPAPGPPTTFIDLSSETIAPGLQYLDYVLASSGGYDSPTTFNGAGIPDAMGPALATQDNYTQFGNAVLVNPGNANCTQVALNNENIQGVTGSSATMAQANSATSGMHFDLAFQDIGLTPLDPETGPFVEVRMLAVITGRSGYFSNQFLPPLNRTPPAGNLGDIVTTITGGGQWLGNLGDNAIAPGQQWMGYTLAPSCGDDPADINGDEVVDSTDISALVGVLLGTNLNPCDVQKANVNGDGGTNGLDIQEFVDEFLN